MAEAQVPKPPELRPVTDECIAQIAEKTFYRHLEQFAITLLRLSDVQYDHAVNDAEHNSWKSCYNVLRIWCNRTALTMGDLRIMLKEAEARGFVEKGTYECILNGTQLFYFTPVMESPLESLGALRQRLREHYLNPVQQNSLLFPWMDEEAQPLHRVYTDIQVTPLKLNESRLTPEDVQSLADMINPGPRGTEALNHILLLGKAGTGKSSLVNKIATDWAKNSAFDMFGLVCHIPLKQLSKNQSIANFIRQNVPGCNTDEQILEQHLQSGEDKTLFILDGLDEIDIRHHPEVDEIITGRKYKNCNFIVTSRPHAARKYENKVSSVVKIEGFSKAQAEEYVGHFLEDDDKREFFRQLSVKNMNGMYKTPMILQALVLLFRENRDFPETLEAIYDKLHFFLKKTCVKRKGLKGKELEEAVHEIGELAFKGLMRSEKRLVFSRDEVKDDDIFKLGLLSGEMTGDGYNPTTTLSFTHETLQQYYTADHVARMLKQGNKEPWQRLKDAIETNMDWTAVPEKLIPMLSMAGDSCFDKGNKKPVKREDGTQKSLKIPFEVLNQKLVDTSRNNHDRTVQQSMEALFKQETIDETLSSEENNLLLDFLAREFSMETTDRRPDDKDWLKLMLIKHFGDSSTFRQYIIEQSNCFTWIKQDPNVAKQTFQQLASNIESENDTSELLDEEPHSSMAQHFTELLDQMEHNRFLFSFIVGKLSTSAIKDEVLLEIAEMLVKHSFNKETGAVLPFHVLSSYMDNLLKEAKCLMGTCLISPALIKLDATNHLRKLNNESRKQCGWTALKISGKDNNVLDEHTLSILNSATKILQRERSTIYTLELEDIRAFMQNPSPTYKAFVQALYQCPKLVSVQLTNVDPGLIALLTKDLPMTVERLSVCADSQQTNARGSYSFPEEVSLRVLRLENCCSSVDGLFGHTTFPRLKELTLKDMMSKANVMRETSRWQTKDVQFLFDGILDDRMPELEDLCIRFRCLKGCAHQLVKVLRQKTLKTVEFVGTRLNLEDGEILLKAIEEDLLNHLRFVNLLMNPGLNPLVEQLRRACNRRDILLQIAAARNVRSDTPTPDIRQFVSRVLKPTTLNGLHLKPQNGDFLKPTTLNGLHLEPQNGDFLKPTTLNGLHLEPPNGDFLEPTTLNGLHLKPQNGDFLKPTTLNGLHLEPQNGDFLKPTTLNGLHLEPQNGDFPT